MSMIDAGALGTYGAKVQSWRNANPRDILKQIIDAAPGADEAELLADFQRRVATDDDMIGAIIAYWFSNNYRSLTRPEAVARPSRAEAASATRKATAAVASNVTRAIKREAMILLDMTMPNGKTLGDCTFREVGKFAGWLGALKKAGKPNQRVRDVLSETQVRKFKGAAK